LEVHLTAQREVCVAAARPQQQQQPELLPFLLLFELFPGVKVMESESKAGPGQSLNTAVLSSLMNNE
jgi:hypothetical protein